MSLDVAFHPLAAVEIVDAEFWYEQQISGLRSSSIQPPLLEPSPRTVASANASPGSKTNGIDCGFKWCGSSRSCGTSHVGIRPVSRPERRDEVDAALLVAVRSARAAQRSWSEIGAMLGVSKQAAQRKYARHIAA